MSAIYRRVRTPLVLLCTTLLFAACSGTRSRDEPVATVAETGPVEPQKQVSEEVKPKIVRVEPVRPDLELTEDILYKLLLAEFAGQKGHLEVAVENYMEIARLSRDHKIIERATRIAVYARNETAAAEAARLWVELDPLNPDPHQVLAVMELRQGNTEQAVSHLHSILDYSHGEMDQKLWMVANMLGREKDAEMVLNVMERLVSTRTSSAEALYAFAHVAARLGDLERSRELLEETLVLMPENDNAVLSYLSVLQRLGEENEAIAWLEENLGARGENDFNLRMAYARLLTDAKRYDDARDQFELLLLDAPNNNEVLYALGLLNLQANRLEDAKIHFERLSRVGLQTDNANYYLGRIAEENKDYDSARSWYQGVNRGENYFDARVRLALLLAKQGNTNKAREHLHLINTDNDQQHIVLVQAEAELLMEEKRYEDAMGVYSKALEGRYDTDLLYARAMVAEKLDRIDILEADLRRILKEEPDHSGAMNALGYTLADRTTRYDEAYELIKTALELSPSDFYILDSMGWVLYRLGRHDEAISYLRRAMSLRQDPEIAAHLGEVLWVKGDKEGAMEVWESALQSTPEDAILLDVIRRFSH